MKKLLILSVLTFLLVGCSKQMSDPTYSNLVDDKMIESISEKLVANGVSSSQVEIFKKQLSNFYDTVETENMVSDFESIKEPTYDPYTLQDKWLSKNNYVGYNCRITSYTLYKDLFQGNGFDENSTSHLLFDYETLNHDKFSQDDINKFNTLFQSFDTENAKDLKVHKENIKNGFKKYGFKFADSNIKLVSVYLHDQVIKPDTDILFVGHTGILIEEKDELLFIEKLAFSEPYQVIKFSDLNQLAEYLLNKYDFSDGQPEARPIITLNDSFLN